MAERLRTTSALAVVVMIAGRRVREQRDALAGAHRRRRPHPRRRHLRRRHPRRPHRGAGRRPRRPRL